MKKVKKILLILVSAIFIFVCSGCDMFVTESQLKRTLENSLEEKYDEEFVCLDVWLNGGSSYWGVCAPEKNHDIRFTALFHTGGGISEEGYYASCVAEKIEENVKKELENVFNDFYLHSYMPVPLYSCENDDIYVENVRSGSFDIDAYVEMANEKWKNETPTISLMICVNSSETNKRDFDEEYDMLSDIFQEVINIGVRPIIYLKFMYKEKYSECIEYLETRDRTDSTFDDMVKDYPVKASEYDHNISFGFEGDKALTITKEEYIKQRNEIPKDPGIFGIIKKVFSVIRLILVAAAVCFVLKLCSKIRSKIRTYHL